MRNKRIITVGALFALVWVGMVGRVFYIQVMQGEEYSRMANNQSVRRTIIPPLRGEIRDRHGNTLAENAQVEVEFSEGNREKSRDLKRVAPNGHLAGQVIGNLGRDGYGQMGLEYQWDKTLRGIDGWRYSRYDVHRRYYPGFEEQRKEPVNGHHIVTTLDVKIQQVAEQALARGVKRSQAKGGVVVIVDPNNGDVLAMANYPFYNPNRRNRADLKAWKNNAVSKVYEPGSTFKIITAASALEEGAVYPEEVFYAEKGAYTFNGAEITDTKPREDISFIQAMAYSSNIVMVKAAHRLNADTFYRYIRSFGFGIKTGVALPAEEGGYLKTVGQWNRRTHTTLAWGQELLVTPLQMAMAGCAVANGGYLLKPRMVLKHLDGDRVVATVPVKRLRRVLSDQTAGYLRGMLQEVVHYGTAKGIRSDRYTIAGKTGTVEKIDPETGLYVKGKFHSSFLGMVPAEKPAYVALVLLDEPQVHKYGGSSAGPIFREIMDRALFFPESPLAPKVQTASSVTPSGHSESSEKAKSDEASSASDGLQAGRGEPSGRESAGEVEPAPMEKASLSGFSSLKLSSLAPQKERSKPVDLENARPLEMPDLNEKSLRDALLMLKGLPVDVEYRGVGQVVRQVPNPGDKLRPGQKCYLELDRSAG